MKTKIGKIFYFGTYKTWIYGIFTVKFIIYSTIYGKKWVDKNSIFRYSFTICNNNIFVISFDLLFNEINIDIAYFIIITDIK